MFICPACDANTSGTNISDMNHVHRSPITDDIHSNHALNASNTGSFSHLTTDTSEALLDSFDFQETSLCDSEDSQGDPSDASDEPPDVNADCHDDGNIVDNFVHELKVIRECNRKRL